MPFKSDSRGWAVLQNGRVAQGKAPKIPTSPGTAWPLPCPLEGVQHVSCLADFDVGSMGGWHHGPASFELLAYSGKRS